MADRIRLPTPKTNREALLAILQVASDKQQHILIQDECDWLEKKLKYIKKLCKGRLRTKEQPPCP